MRQKYQKKISSEDQKADDKQTTEHHKTRKNNIKHETNSQNLEVKRPEIPNTKRQEGQKKQNTKRAQNKKNRGPGN